MSRNVLWCGRRRWVAAALASLALLPDGAAAQSDRPDRRQRPFKPLYQDEGSAPPRSLIFAFGTYGGFGEDVGGRDQGSGSGLEKSRFYSGGTGGIAYMHRGPRSVVTLDAGGGARYYPNLQQIVSVGHRAGFGLDFRPGRSRLLFGASVRMTPYQQLLPQLGAEGLASRANSGPDTALSATSNTERTGTASWSRAVGRRGGVALDYGVNSAHSSDGIKQRTQRGGGSFSFLISRGVNLRLGYHSRLVQDLANSAKPDVIAHDLDLGLDVERELAFSRRTRVGFTSGASVVTTDQGRRSVAVGTATLKREIGRSWNAVSLYERKVDIVEGFAQPVLSNTITSGVGGYWGRRLNTTVRASFGKGTIGLVDGAQFTSFSTEARASLMVQRGWQWYVEHFYYQHVTSGAALAPGVPGELFRSGIRSGLDIRFDALRGGR